MRCGFGMNIAVYMYGLSMAEPKKHQGGSGMGKTQRKREYRDRFLTIQDLAEMFHCSKNTIYDWVGRNLFPQGLRLANSRTRRWLESEVWEWVKNQQAEQERKRSSE